MDSICFWGWVFFLLYMVAIVYLAYRGIQKTRSLKDYVVAPRSYGPITIALALFATACSAGAAMGNPGLVHKFGWPALWYTFGYGGVVIAWAATAYKLSKVGGSVGAKSLPDFFGIRFQSDFMRAFAAIVTLLFVYYVAGQFVGIGWIFDKVLNIPYTYGVIGAAIIMALYIVLGGTHADILTCAIQGIIMVFLAVVVVFTVFYFIGDVSTINAILTKKDPSLGWDVIFKNPYFGPFTGPGIFIALTLVGLTPQMGKMWFALKHESQISACLIWSLIFLFSFGLLMWLGGLGSRVVFDNAAPDTSMLEMLVKFMPAPIIAIAGIGILAAIMSTAAGLFLVVGIAVGNDIFRDTIVPHFAKKMDPNKADKTAVVLTRIVIVIVLIAGLSIAFNPPKLLTALIWVGLGGFVGGLCPVMVLGCLWRRTSKAGAITGSVIGFGAYMFCYFILGKQMGMTFWLVPWAGCAVGVILSFAGSIVVSLMTKPFAEEHLRKIYGETSN